MKAYVTLVCIFLTAMICPLRAATDTFTDYQNYNHGYCPDCNCFPCRCNAAAVQEEAGAAPCSTCPNGAVPQPSPVPGNPPTCSPCKKPEPCAPAPVCGTNCGVSLCWIGLGIAVIATAAAIIVSSNNGADPSH